MEVGQAVGLQVLLPADPRIGHDGAAAAGLPGLAGLPVATATAAGGAVEGVVGAELVANLVGHVVDEEGIPHRIGGARHARRFLSGAEHSQPRQTAAPGVDHVTYVEGAKLGAGLGLCILLHCDVGIYVTVIVVERIGGGVGEDDGVVAAGELELGGDVTLVHLVDPVEQGGDGAETRLDGAAVILGVLPRRRDGDDVALALVAIHQDLTGQGLGLGPDDLVRLFLQPAVGILLVIDGVAFTVSERIHEHHAALVAEHGVETLGTEIEAPRLHRVGLVIPLECQNAGIPGGEIRWQQIIGLQVEGHLLAIRQRQGQPRIPSLQTGEVIGRHSGNAILAGPHLITIGSGGPRRHRIPLTGGQAGGVHQTGHQQRQRRVFHQLHLYYPFFHAFA
ncbi:hypothetical protein D3C86_837550 [compost metagenome]